MPGALDYELRSKVWETYIQDKWAMSNGFSLSMGLRYDLEIIPIDETDNALFSDPTKYPVDKNNVAPRLGFIWNPDGQGKSVVRGGYGLFYDWSLLGTIDNYLFDTKYSKTFTASFPQNAADPGPSNGRLPTDPLLAMVTQVSTLSPEIRAYLNSLFPPGTTRRNTGTVTWDDPERTQPYFHQITVGYERELFSGVSASADYVRMVGRDMFLNPDLNIGTRLNTSRTGPIIRTDPFGILNPSLKPGEAAYAGPVRLLTTKYGYSNYDALNLSVEKRYANNWSLRGAYALCTLGAGRGRGRQNDSASPGGVESQSGLVRGAGRRRPPPFPRHQRA